MDRESYYALIVPVENEQCRIDGTRCELELKECFILSLTGNIIATKVVVVVGAQQRPRHKAARFEEPRRRRIRVEQRCEQLVSLPVLLEKVVAAIILLDSSR